MTIIQKAQLPMYTSPRVIIVQAYNFDVHAYLLCITIYPGDSELASMGAGVTRGDKQSTSDSALGAHSAFSAFSVTTAGVTQFSEVSQISGCYWLS